MSFEEAKKVWLKRAEDAIDTLECLFDHSKMDFEYEEEVEYFKLIDWMLNTKINPYSYLNSSYASFTSDVHVACSLFSAIRHAFMDDGDISFINMLRDGEVVRVYISFFHHGEISREWELAENRAYIDSSISASKSSNRIWTELAARYPERGYKQKPVLTEEDFEFVAHCDVNKFIADIEQHEQNLTDRAQKLDDKLAKLRCAN